MQTLQKYNAIGTLLKKNSCVWALCSRRVFISHRQSGDDVGRRITGYRKKKKSNRSIIARKAENQKKSPDQHGWDPSGRFSRRSGRRTKQRKRESRWRCHWPVHFFIASKNRRSSAEGGPARLIMVWPGLTVQPTYTPGKGTDEWPSRRARVSSGHARPDALRRAEPRSAVNPLTRHGKPVPTF